MFTLRTLSSISVPRLIVYFLVTLLLSLLSFLALVYPWFYSQIINEIQEKRFPNNVLLIFGGTVVFGLTVEVLLLKLYLHFYRSLLEGIQMRLIEISFSQTEKDINAKGEGYFIQLITEVSYSVMRLISPMTVTSLLAVFQGIFVLYIFYTVDFWIFAIGAVCAVGYIVNIFLNGEVYKKKLGVFYEEHRTFTSYYTERLGLISLYSLLPKFRENILGQIKTRLSSLMKKNSSVEFYFETMFRAVGKFLVPISRVIVLGMVSRLYIEGQISIGTIFLVVSYFLLLEQSFGGLSSISETYARTEEAAKAVFESIRERKEAKPFNSRIDFLLCFRGVELRYDEKVIVSEASFTLETDVTYGLVSLSGQGKTSLISAIMGALQPAKGQIFVGNISNNTKYVSCGERIVVLRQDAPVFNGTLSDNILLGEEMDEGRYSAVISDCGLANLEDRVLGKSGAFVSGGERRRINLARFLYHLSDEMFFVLDEPVISVDNISRKNLVAVIKKYVHGRSGLVVSHDMDLVRVVCDQVVYLDEDGRIRIGGFEQLRALSSFNAIVTAGVVD